MFLRDALFFAEGALEVVGNGFDQVGNPRAVAGLDESLDRHAGHKLDLAATGHLFGAHGDANGVIMR